MKRNLQLSISKGQLPGEQVIENDIWSLSGSDVVTVKMTSLFIAVVASTLAVPIN